MSLNKHTICFFCLQLSRGGSERVTSILGNYFCKQGYDTTIVTLEKAPIDYHIESGINVVWLSEGKYRNIISIIKKLKLIFDNKDVIVVMNNRPIVLTAICSKFSKARKIYSERNAPNKVPNGFVARINRNISFKTADAYVFQTEEQAHYYGKQAVEHSRIIMNPISDNLPVRNYKKDNKVIISVCRYDRQKNLYMAVDAFTIFWKDHKDYKFELYGRGPEEGVINKYIQSKGMQNSIKLKRFHNNIHEIMANATAFILSSDYEGISNSMIEAMGIGLPVICTDCPVGGARKIIQHGINGFLVGVGDVKRMAYYLNLVVDDNMIQKSIGCNAKKIRDELSISKICAQWYEYIEEVLDK